MSKKLRILKDGLDRKITEGGGKATLTTVEGETLTVTGNGQVLTVTDNSGDAAHVTIADVYQKNGVIMVVDKVLLPK